MMVVLYGICILCIFVWSLSFFVCGPFPHTKTPHTKRRTYLSATEIYTARYGMPAQTGSSAGEPRCGRIVGTNYIDYVNNIGPPVCFMSNDNQTDRFVC